MTDRTDILIIGNGPAGTEAAKAAREKDSAADIRIVSSEGIPYYARPRLPDLIAGKASTDDIIIHPPSWYENNEIKLQLNLTITRIDPDGHCVHCQDGQVIGYDRLILCTGADAVIPPIQMDKGVTAYTLRTTQDAEQIRKAAEGKKSIIVIGGGLLGLELANSFTVEHDRIRVIEMADHLLPKQLDHKKSQKLMALLDDRGFEFHMGEQCTYIRSKDDRIEVETQKGHHISGELLVISAGASPRIGMIESSEIEARKGIVVDSHMKTNRKDIYAAGDCIEPVREYWGFVKSSREQGRIAGMNAVGPKQEEYAGTDLNISLRVTGVNLREL